MTAIPKPAPTIAAAVRAPYYRPIAGEVQVFRYAYETRLPLLLKGPTGCGKSRFVEAMAAAVGRPLVTIACNDETTASDLLGRWLVRGGDTVWQDGPVTRAVRNGAILYLDEIAEAREDVIVVLHALSDHRRALYVDRIDETLHAPPEFMMVVSYNPGYRRALKEMKPSTRQRFVSLSFGHPAPDVEVEIVCTESGVDPALLLVSDGKPMDYDRYEGRYGVADVRQAVHEAEQQRITCFALAVDATARDYLPRLFGQGNYALLPRPDALTGALARVVVEAVR